MVSINKDMMHSNESELLWAELQSAKNIRSYRSTTLIKNYPMQKKKWLEKF